MVPGKVFQDSQKRINALDFYHDGTLLVTSSDDESLSVYNAMEGTKTKTVFSKKYGIDLIRFTHHSNAIVCASKNQWDESLRYLSLHDNRYLRYFKGHRDRVTSLAMSPRDDFFMSASLDGTIRLWDLNNNSCQGLLRHSGRHSVCFDPQGLIFSVASESKELKLYDLRSFDRGPFSSWTVPMRSPPIGTKFSNDGKWILLSCQFGGGAFLLDAFSGELLQRYTDTSLESASARQGITEDCEASFSPDAEYVLCGGAADGTICVWERQSGALVTRWRWRENAVSTVQWDPRSVLVASGDANGALTFWIPNNLHSSEQ